MPDLQDGESVEIQGSASKPYIIKNVGGVYSCSCPAWRNQSPRHRTAVLQASAQFRGEKVEQRRVGQTMPAPSHPTTPKPKPIVPALLLAETWSPAAEVTGWLLSEKLDGVRAYWDGEHFWSRLGNRFYAPDWFVAGLPNMPLDGELWLTRKAFRRMVSIVRLQDESDLWRDLKFRMFDAPTANGRFEERIECLCDCFSKLRLRYASVLPQMRCRGVEHLQEELDRIESLGEEGLMRHRA